METKNILVCVTQQKNCERLINAAHEMQQEYGGSINIINVVKNDVNFLDSTKESEALEYLFGISKSIGANLTVLKSDDIVGTIAQFARDNDIKCIIMGKSPAETGGNLYAKKLASLLGKGVEIKIMS